MAVSAVLGVVGALAVAVAAGPAAVKPEYARVAGLVGLVGQERIDGVQRSVFTSQDKRWSAVLLENQIMAALEDRLKAMERLERPPLVTVTGVVSEYRGRNYLMLTAAQVGLPAPEGA